MPKSSHHFHLSMLAAVWLQAAWLPLSAADAPLAPRVDALIAVQAKGQPLSPAADDAEFLRRVWLDFDGGIPTSAEAREFLTDKSPDKRAKLIERLMDSSRYPERLADGLHVMLMERRGENEEWRKWLVESLKANKPWDVMVREILAPDFADEKQRGAGYFITRRLEKVGQQDTDYPGLTRDVGRMFMGVDLQCCQCHRHLSVDDYKQIDFNGLLTVYQNLKLQQTDAAHKTPWVSEGLISKPYEFASVLTGKKGETSPRVPFSEPVMIPELKGDDAWEVKPNPKTKVLGQPKFSPLSEIAKRLPSPENPLFARNIANRIWFLLMGRGLVEPLDLQHGENPASHPELLDLLASELVAHHFDLRWLTHELAMTKTYQRSSTLPDGVTSAPDNLFLTANERHLTYEQQFRTFLLATGEWDRLEKNTKPDLKDDDKKYSLADFKKAFTTALANPAKEPELAVNPSLRSALFFRNSDHVQWAMKPRDANLIDRLSKISDPNALADEMYLSILTRLPLAEEKTELTGWLGKNAANKPQAIADFAWALVSSTEFFANH